MSWSSASSPEPGVRAAAVIVAGGSGRRMADAAGGVPKQFLEVQGKPVLLWAVGAFLDHPGIHEVVVVLPAAQAAAPPEWLRALPVRIAAGGAERGDSVWSGLELVPEGVDVVLIHDGARPFVSPAVIDRVLGGVGPGGALAALAATDTLKEVDVEGRVTATVERSRIWHAQTPQGFPLPLLREVHRRARKEGWRGTDDASLCERYGVPVRVVEGAPENFKITRPFDLQIAEAVARALRDA